MNNKYFHFSFSFTDVLKLVVGECKEGASVRTVCEIGDSAILDGTNKIFKKDKELKKGTLYFNLFLC